MRVAGVDIVININDRLMIVLVVLRTMLRATAISIVGTDYNIVVCNDSFVVAVTVVVCAAVFVVTIAIGVDCDAL